MGDTKDPPDPAGAGTLARMKKTFNRLVQTNSGRQGLQVFKGEVMKEWSELSKKLQPGSKLEERSSALAFVVRHCYILLDTQDFVGNTGVDADHKALVHDILGILQVCVEDHTDCKPMPRNCFQFYGDCLAVMDVFTKRAWSLRMTVGSGVDAHVALASHLQFEIQQAIYCMSRCWSVLRSKNGTLIVSPATGQEKSPTAFEADMRTQIVFLQLAKARDPAIDAGLMQFCKLGLQFICVLSCNMLKGMGTTAELWVDKQASDAKFSDCCELLGVDKEAEDKRVNDFTQLLGIPGANTSLKSLGEIFNLVINRRDHPIVVADQQKQGKRTYNKQQLNKELKLRLGSDRSPPKLKSIAAEVLSAGGLSGYAELFSAIWGEDIGRGHNKEGDHFADQASCLLFSAAPFTCAMATLSRYFEDSLQPDATGIAKVEGRTIVEDMYIEIKSRKEKIESRAKQTQEKLLQDFAEDEKKTQGKPTPKKRAGPQSSSPTMFRPGQKNTSTSGSTSKSQSEPLGQKFKMDTAEGTLKSPGRQPVGGSEEVADPAHVDKQEDKGGREKAHLTQGISSAAIGSVTPQALAGDPTREELEQAEEEFVNSCDRPPQEMKALLQNVAEVEEHARNLRALSEAVHLLGLSTLRELGLHFSTGRRHPDPKLDRFNTDLPGLVEFLAEAGRKGSFVSFVEDMSIHFGNARAVAAAVTNDGEDATTAELKELGFAILMFTIAACRLSKALLQNTP